ncbi:hypothetical protein NCS55_00232200 [Fusarium keratoplasticum]|nr:hypothetical protein NCS55_00232200 [Fusarium keratoplasticum]
MEAGRRQTQPWDDSFDIRGNAYNNVRNSWIEQGIWRKAWDEPWAKETDVGLFDPSPRSLTPEPTKSRPGYQWGHEDGGPPPDQEFERDLFRTIYVVGDLGMSEEQPKWTRNSEGSRPYRQFLYQIVKEREWIKDEMNFQIQFRPYNVNLDSMAYETVKNNWIEDRIWKPEWNELPGSTWAHEDPLQEQDKVDHFRIVDDSGEQPSTVVHDPSKGLRHNPQHSVPSSHDASDPAGTGKETPAPKGVITKEHQGGESSSAQTKGGKRRRPRRGDQHDTPRSAKRQKKSGKHGRGKSREAVSSAEARKRWAFKSFVLWRGGQVHDVGGLPS